MVGDAKLGDVKTIRAHVRNGQIVLDEPVELPDGTLVEVLVPLGEESMTPEEQAEIEREVDLSWAEYQRGEYIEARELIRQSKSRPRS